MNKPLDRDSIARAMNEAAWVAKHGTREERSGKFIPPRVPSPPNAPVAPRTRDR